MIYQNNKHRKLHAIHHMHAHLLYHYNIMTSELYANCALAVWTSYSNMLNAELYESVV